MANLSRLTRCCARLPRRPLRLLAAAAFVAAALVAALPSGAAAAAPFSGSASGTVTFVGTTSLTIQTVGRRTGVINTLTAAANRVTKDDYPYVYGGGHAQAGLASIGIRGPGYNGRRMGFDCSGSVAAVLAAAGLWPAGSGVPNDAGIITTLLDEKLIAPGVGTGPLQVTLYDHRGVHIFMNIDGRFFGTSDGAGGGNPRGGAGWLDDGAPDAGRHDYRRYHFLRSVLRTSTSSGHIVSFQTTALPAVGGLEIGEQVHVDYTEAGTGGLIATAVTFPGATVVSGSVGTVAPDDSLFTIQTPSGSTLTFDTAGDSALAQSLAPGDSVQVTYATTGSGRLIAHAVNITASVSASPAAQNPPGIGAGYGGGSYVVDN